MGILQLKEPAAVKDPLEAKIANALSARLARRQPRQGPLCGALVTGAGCQELELTHRTRSSCRTLRSRSAVPALR